VETVLDFLLGLRWVRSEIERDGRNVDERWFVMRTFIHSLLESIIYEFSLTLRPKKEQTRDQ
jgi:hypothetical protein